MLPIGLKYESTPLTLLECSKNCIYEFGINGTQKPWNIKENSKVKTKEFCLWSGPIKGIKRRKATEKKIFATNITPK